MRWVGFDGYNEEAQYVEESTGRIVGTVSGSEYEEEQGWCAFDESRIPAKHLGRYRTQEDARHAVERSVASKRRKVRK